MKTTITTANTPAMDRSSYWHEAIARAYFPLNLRFRSPGDFSGDLSTWQLGDVSLSRFTSEALQYRRLSNHFKTERDEHFLVTVPARSEVYFPQCGKDVHCNPGGLILERNHEPYEFSHNEVADLWAMKVEAKALGGRIRQPDSFCSLQFDASQGAGGLFSDLLHLIPLRFDAMTEEVHATVGQQLVDLLVLAVKGDERTLTTGNSTVCEAHLTLTESFIRKNLSDRQLDPETIARACGISMRYLHEVFRDTNQTVGSWIRDQRLEAWRAALKDQAYHQSVAEIANRWGFGDQAQFSRIFKAQFGIPPKEFREQTRAGRLAQR